MATKMSTRREYFYAVKVEAIVAVYGPVKRGRRTETDWSGEAAARSGPLVLLDESGVSGPDSRGRPYRPAARDAHE